MTTDQTGTHSDVAVLASRVVSFFAPKPSPVDLMRVGGNRDGAYLVPKSLSGITACFSPGVANRKDFEDELWMESKIRSHLLDASSDLALFETPLLEGKQSFRKEWLASETADGAVTLDDWVLDAEPETEADLMMQMDIEGAEYENILGCSRSVLERFRIVVVEFHNVASMILGENTERQKLAHTIDRLGEIFVSVHARANNCCPVIRIPGTQIRVPEVLEVTLLRKDQLDSPSRSRKAMVPHPLDIRRNVRLQRPVHLSGPWKAHSSFLLPGLKILTDWTSFFFQYLGSKGKRITHRVLNGTYLMFSAQTRRNFARLRAWMVKK